MADTRWPLREWQVKARRKVIDKLMANRVATLMAAPGAGKTIFAGAVFAVGAEMGLWERLVVLVPRKPLVKQWARDLLEQQHIHLDDDDGARQSGRELRGMDGVVTTYQSLMYDKRGGYLDMAQQRPTLFVTDEVHHLGEPNYSGSTPGAWAKALKAIVGDVNQEIRVSGVLNLSGTLFRTSPRERISTVEYRSVENDKIEALVDYEIHPEELIRQRQLRAPDLFRVGATVEIVNLSDGVVSTSRIADLTDSKDQRCAMRDLNRRPEWIDRMVAATLEQLEQRHRDLRRAPVKALIVANRQEMARAFEAEVNRQMVRRGFTPFAECVVSDDGPDAYRRLDAFREAKSPGVLCTVGMAGEGYNCPPISVVTYATNVLTHQYIRQVVARGQRITDYERQAQRIMTTAVIVPDVPALVERFVNILSPMVHELEAATPPPPPPPPVWPPPPPPPPTRELVHVHDASVEIVTVVATDGAGDVDPRFADMVPFLEAQNLSGSEWPRVALAMQAYQKQQPFDAPLVSRTVAPVRPEPVTRDATAREQSQAWRKQLVAMGKWWATFGVCEQSVAYFWAEIKQAADIRDLDHATAAQLERAYSVASSKVMRFCATHPEVRLPRGFDSLGGDQAEVTS